MKDGSGMSPWASQAISNINAGNTPYQRRKAFNQKAIGTGITAGIGLIGGVMKGVESESLQKKQAQAVEDKRIQAAIRNAKRPPSHPDDTPRDEYGLEVERASYGKAMDRAVEGGKRESLHSQPFTTPDTRELAKNIAASNDANEHALAAPIAGRWTTKGFADADMNASVNASDIDRLKAMMRQAGQQQSFGGLGNSFNGGQ